jgi:WD40 repeat protein
VENWKPLTRLVGHQAGAFPIQYRVWSHAVPALLRWIDPRPDVVDIAWSRDDSMLASTGLDSKVWIWDGQTFGEPLILVAIRCKCGRD